MSLGVVVMGIILIIREIIVSRKIVSRVGRAFL